MAITKNTNDVITQDDDDVINAVIDTVIDDYVPPKFKTIYDSKGNPHQVFDDYVVPDYMALEPKPAVKIDQIATIINQKWVIHADHRNKVAYLKADRSQFYVVDQIGEIPPSHTLIESEAKDIEKAPLPQ